VNPSISTTFTVKYNDYNRKVLINPKDFVSAGINTITNTITILNHNFKRGQKVIHTAVTPANGLENNKEYFIFIVDDNKIKLTTLIMNLLTQNLRLLILLVFLTEHYL
jgi:hypothetical protein